jgi:hypothetical protein
MRTRIRALLLAPLILASAAMILAQVHSTDPEAPRAAAAAIDPTAGLPPPAGDDEIACFVFAGDVSVPISAREKTTTFVTVDLAAWVQLCAQAEIASLPREALESYEGCRAYFVFSSRNGMGRPEAEGVLADGRKAWIRLKRLRPEEGEFPFHDVGFQVKLGYCGWCPGSDGGQSMTMPYEWSQVTDEQVLVHKAQDHNPQLRDCVVAFPATDQVYGPSIKLVPVEIP